MQHKVFENEGMRNILLPRVTIGTGEDGKQNIEKLRYHKVVIMCNFDIDDAISTLILTFSLDA